MGKMSRTKFNWKSNIAHKGTSASSEHTVLRVEIVHLAAVTGNTGETARRISLWRVIVESVC